MNDLGHKFVGADRESSALFLFAPVEIRDDGFNAYSQGGNVKESAESSRYVDGCIVEMGKNDSEMDYSIELIEIPHLVTPVFPIFDDSLRRSFKYNDVSIDSVKKMYKFFNIDEPNYSTRAEELFIELLNEIEKKYTTWEDCFNAIKPNMTKEIEFGSSKSYFSRVFECVQEMTSIRFLPFDGEDTLFRSFCKLVMFSTVSDQKSSSSTDTNLLSARLLKNSYGLRFKILSKKEKCAFHEMKKYWIAKYHSEIDSNYDEMKLVQL